MLLIYHHQESSMVAVNGKRQPSSCTVYALILFLSNLLVFQLSTIWRSEGTIISSVVDDTHHLLSHHFPRNQEVPQVEMPPVDPQDEVPQGGQQDAASSTSSLHIKPNTKYGWNPSFPLAIPEGQPPNLPSLRAADKEVDAERTIYGGSGDGAHLGGFTAFDGEGVSPLVWAKMITEYGVHSLLDVGCGRGISSRWFLEHGVDILCVEGSHDGLEKSFLPRDRIVEHDYSRGPWWPQETYDAVWSVEFLEHVSRQYRFNYINTFRKAALIFVTSSRWGGWHHVEVHPDDWWITKFESYGFRYNEVLTKQVKEWAGEERHNSTLFNPDGKRRSAAHVISSMKVFVNPSVAALPKHAHLFPRPGCFKEYATTKGAFESITKSCTDKHLTPLPFSYDPLPVLPEMHQRWEMAILEDLNLTASEKH